MHDRRGLSRLLLPLTLLAVLAATVVLTVRDHRAAVAAHTEATDAALSLAASRTEEAVSRGVVALDGVAGLFRSSQQVDPGEFATFAASASTRGELLPGVSAYAWALEVDGADVAAFERDVLGGIPAELRADPRPTVRPPPAEGEQAIVVALAHRLDDLPSPAQGFALSSSEDRLAALRESERTGTTTATAPLELVSDTSGMLLTRPVRDADGTTEGWAVLAIETTPFLASVVRDRQITVDLVDDATGRSVVDPGDGVTPADADRSSSRTTQLDVLGRSWSLTATPATRPPGLLSAGGLPARLLPLLLVVGVFVLVERERREKVRTLEAAAAAEQDAARREHELAQTQRRLLSTVSHELRTPLTSIIGYGSLLVEQLHGDERLHGFAKRIAANAVVLKDLVDDLLAFSRLERGEFTLLPEPHELAALTRDTLEAIEPILDGHEVVLHATPVHAAVDGTAFRRAVSNLVENAVRYGGDERVEVLVTAEENHAVIHVDDRGAGVDPSEREQVFERFARGSTGRAANSSGTGLGLSVVRGLTEAMGGTATVGDAPTGGARFTIRLPLLPETDRPPATPPVATDRTPQLEDAR